MHMADCLRCLFFTAPVKLDTYVVVAVGQKDSHRPVDC